VEYAVVEAGIVHVIVFLGVLVLVFIILPPSP